MPIERGRVELRQNVDSLDLRVDAIADGNIDQAIFGAEGNGRLGAKFGKRVEPLSGTSAQNNGQYSFHKVGLINRLGLWFASRFLPFFVAPANTIKHSVTCQTDYEKRT